jgi:hypothetical protein
MVRGPRVSERRIRLLRYIYDGLKTVQDEVEGMWKEIMMMYFETAISENHKKVSL